MSLLSVKHYWSIILLFFCFNTSYIHGKDIPPIKFSHITKAQGLSNNNINTVTKDQLGFLWIGTNDGLCRYDAYNQFKIFRPDPNIPEGLKSSNIRSLHVTNDNTLWIGTRLGGLTQFDQAKNEWKTYINDSTNPNSISNNEILDIMEDSKGRLWIGTEDGLNLYRPETGDFINFKAQKDTPDQLQANAVLSIIEDNNGWIWIGTWAGGLYLMMPDENGKIEDSKFRRFQLGKEIGADNIWNIHQDKAGRYWIGTHGGGLFLMQLPDGASNFQGAQNWKPKFHNYLMDNQKKGKLSFNTIQDIMEDSKGRIWVATVYGLNHIEAEDLPKTKIDKKRPNIFFQKHFFDPVNPNSLANNSINQVYEDSQGMIWVATTSGISKHNWYTSQFEVFELFGHLSQTPNCQKIYVDPKGIGWLGTGEHGLIRYDFEKKEVLRFQEDEFPNQKFVSSIFSPDDVRRTRWQLSYIQTG